MRKIHQVSKSFIEMVWSNSLLLLTPMDFTWFVGSQLLLESDTWSLIPSGAVKQRKARVIWHSLQHWEGRKILCFRKQKAWINLKLRHLPCYSSCWTRKPVTRTGEIRERKKAVFQSHSTLTKGKIAIDLDIDYMWQFYALKIISTDSISLHIVLFSASVKVGVPKHLFSTLSTLIWQLQEIKVVNKQTKKKVVLGMSDWS